MSSLDIAVLFIHHPILSPDLFPTPDLSQMHRERRQTEQDSSLFFSLGLGTSFHLNHIDPYYCATSI